MNKKRYQVFISSTYCDLIEERQAVLKAILELDLMPAGMELFPAADDTAWQLIKDVIDSSDYYVLLVGGRYGSIHEGGLSYTEKEYDYAVQKKKPVMAFLHKHLDALPRGKTDIDPTAWDKLQQFRGKVEERHTCSYWESAEELKARVIVSVTRNVKRHPAVGWVRADVVPSDATLRDVLALRKRVSELESQLDQIRTEPPEGTEDLLQGEDTFEVAYHLLAYPPDAEQFDDATPYDGSTKPTWNEIFAAIAPVMINEASDSEVRKAFHDWVAGVVRQELAEGDLAKHEIVSIGVSNTPIDTCLVQLRALGLIRESDRRRSLKDTATYWTLTPYGDRRMVQLRALRRTPAAKRSPGGKPAPVDQS
jgi:hypothetical protein